MPTDKIKKTARIYALQNAIQFNGTANIKAVAGKVIAARIDDDIFPKEIYKISDSVCLEVNKIPIDQQKAELEKLAPELLKREKEIDKLEVEKHRYLQKFFISSLLLVIILAVTIYSRYILKKKSHKQLQEAYDKILEQKNILDEKEIQKSSMSSEMKVWYLRLQARDLSVSAYKRLIDEGLSKDELKDVNDKSIELWSLTLPQAYRIFRIYPRIVESCLEFDNNYLVELLDSGLGIEEIDKEFLIKLIGLGYKKNDLINLYGFSHDWMTRWIQDNLYMDLYRARDEYWWKPRIIYLFKFKKVI